MRKRLFFIVSVFVVFLGRSQETVPIYQQYLLDGEFLFNPAYFGATNDIVFNANYQKQFSQFDESPNVQSIGVHANVVDRLGVGLSFFRDQNGPISANGISAGASYFIPLSDEDDRRDQFSFGTSVNFYNMNFDYSKINPQDAGDPLLSGNNSIFIAYANIGMQATYKGFFGGISVVDIALNNDIPIVNGIEPSPTKFYINSGFDWDLGDAFSLEPSVMVNLNTNSSRMMDFNVLAKFKNENNVFSGGVSYRMAKGRFGDQQLNVSPLLKLQINRLDIGMVYNFGLSNIQNYGGNSFMLSLGYRLENFINTRGFRVR